VWGVGFGLVTLDRLIVLAIETLWVRGSQAGSTKH
jgi:hypothetical protein